MCEKCKMAFVHIDFCFDRTVRMGAERICSRNSSGYCDDSIDISNGILFLNSTEKTASEKSVNRDIVVLIFRRKFVFMFNIWQLF